MNTDTAQIYTDFSGLSELRAQAREDKTAALDTVARQFESLFVQMMMKSMRDASFGGGLLDSSNSEFYQDMYDKQMSVNLTEKSSIGLADMIKRQLGGDVMTAQTGLSVEDYRGQPIITVHPSGETRISENKKVEERALDLGSTPEEFLSALWPVASDAAANMDIEPEALLAQAALESGWGQHVMQRRNGESSHNLFGIKSDRRWDGEKVQVNTLEYKDGIAMKTRANFRAYASFEESFSDYVNFVQSNPRYADALRVSGDAKAYLKELQQAGYATDPKYAEKIGRILDGDAMRQVRQQQGDAKAI